MTVVDGRTNLGVLSRAECVTRLDGSQVGRVGFVNGAHVEVMPVAYANEGTSVWFRTDRGTKLTGVVGWPEVAFEIDAFDIDTRQGWSVLLIGPATEDVPPVWVAGDPRLQQWAPGPKSHWVHIEGQEVSGRCLRPAPVR